MSDEQGHDPDDASRAFIEQLEASGFFTQIKGLETNLKTIAGEGEFSELFLENVRIPVENRVGAENDGWRVTNVTLRFERGTAFASDMISLQQFVDRLLLSLTAGIQSPDVGQEFTKSYVQFLRCRGEWPWL